MATITLTFNTTTDNITASAVKNQVRRAFEKGELSGDKGEIAGVAYSIKRPKTRAKVETEASKTRVWGRENGFEVGKRGVLSPKLIEAYKAATV